MLNKDLEQKEQMKLRCCVLCQFLSFEVHVSKIIVRYRNKRFDWFLSGSPLVQRYGMGKIVPNEGCLYSPSQWRIGHPKFWEIWRGNILILSANHVYIEILVQYLPPMMCHDVYTEILVRQMICMLLIREIMYTLLWFLLEQTDKQVPKSAKSGPWRKVQHKLWLFGIMYRHLAGFFFFFFFLSRDE